jgi:effector-binding domain-containing protein
MSNEPKIDQRSEQAYLGIRTRTPMDGLPTVIPRLIGEVFGFLGQQGIEPVGAPFIRYHVINMQSNLDVEIGVPTAQPAPGNGHIKAGSLPAGRYASLVHVGPYPELLQANAALLEWGKEHGVRWDQFDDPNGDAFVARYESYLSEPHEKPERTEIAIKLRD